MGHQGIAINDICEEDKIEGLEICPSSVEITSIGNVSKSTNNERNEMNYTEELKEKDLRFCPST